MPAVYVGSMNDSDPIEPIALALEDIPWQTSNPDGSRSATLVGTRAPGELFTYAFYMPAGFYDAPHFHSPAIHLHVAQGVLQLGPSLRSTELASYPAGSFLWLPPDFVHTDCADVDTIIFGTALGPWSTTYVDDAAKK